MLLLCSTQKKKDLEAKEAEVVNLQEANAQLKKDLKGAKGQADAKQSQEKIKELQGSLQQANKDKEDLKNDVEDGKYLLKHLGWWGMSLKLETAPIN